MARTKKSNAPKRAGKKSKPSTKKGAKAPARSRDLQGSSKAASKSLARKAPGAPKAALARVGRLASGRQIAIGETAGGGETLEVRAPDGTLELRIALTDQGPVLSLRGVRLEIDSTEAVAVRCKEFAVETTGGLDLRAGGDVRLNARGEVGLRSSGATNLDAEVLNLNCADRSEWAESDARRVAEGNAMAEKMLEQAGAMLPAPKTGERHEHGPGCSHG
ncbi:MAG: hypothetical protein SFY95_04960 [Planctomycetota bacterium]|nr:hypothetical protein [Planctomycetota bacterium]